MRYLSLDLETTGLDSQKDQILMIGAVVEDTEASDTPVEQLRTFGCYIKHARYEGSSYALAMNAWILDILSGRKTGDWPVINSYESNNPDQQPWVSQFSYFLYNSFPLQYDGEIVLAGKSVANFDYQFLPSRLRQHFSHRMIDPGNCLIDWSKSSPPSLNDLKKRFDIPGPVTHDAVEDARDVIRILRKGTNNYTKSL
jgi:oligoribonuclease (3'-5' exoribonuclease)